MQSAVNPGAGLDEMNHMMIQNVAVSMGALIPSGEKSVRIGLSNNWLRDVVTPATTNSVYGPQNPFKEHAVGRCFLVCISEKS